jgi:hypothetical protein
MLRFPCFPHQTCVSVDRAQGNGNADQRRDRRHKIGIPIAIQAQRADALARRQSLGMIVVYSTIHHGENVAEYDRSQRHKAPVHAQATNAKGIGYERRVNAEQCAITESTEAGNNPEEVRVRHKKRRKLCEREDATAYNDTPEPW